MILAFLLVGCNKGDNTDKPTAIEGKPSEKNSITFMTPPWGVPPKEEALNKFTEETGISVEVISVPMAQIYSKVQIAYAANQNAADVIFLSEEAPSYIVALGAMEPLDAYLERGDLDIDDFMFQETWLVGDKPHGIITYVQMVMMDYNKAKFEEAGFTNLPQTWEELRDQALVIKEKGVDEYPISLGVWRTSWLMMSLGMGDTLFDEDYNPVFANEGSPARKAMEMLIKFFTEDELITPSLLTEESPHAVFRSGVGVFHQGWQGSLVSMNNPETSLQAPNVHYMILPGTGVTWGSDAAIGISKLSDKKDSAWEFIKWYVAEENQKDIYEAYGLVPSRISVQDTLGREGKIDGYEEIVEQSKQVTTMPRFTKWWGSFCTRIGEEVRLGWQGNKTSDQIIDDLAEYWNELKTEYQE